jgi:quercetin dioxygenase-like cupin family protein
MAQKVFQMLEDILPVATAHTGGGLKLVFLKPDDSNTALTQFAYGKFLPGDCVEDHAHPTMEECFFFLKGMGSCTILGETYTVKPGAFLRIPPGAVHNLVAEGEDVLEFVYFGIALNSEE